jgi:hypothetical protein
MVKLASHFALLTYWHQLDPMTMKCTHQESHPHRIQAHLQQGHLGCWAQLPEIHLHFLIPIIHNPLPCQKLKCNWHQKSRSPYFSIPNWTRKWVCRSKNFFKIYAMRQKTQLNIRWRILAQLLLFMLVWLDTWSTVSQLWVSSPCECALLCLLSCRSLRRAVSAPGLSGMLIAPTVNIIHIPPPVSPIRLYDASQTRIDVERPAQQKKHH